MKLDAAARELVGSGADATLVTLNSDGSPQATLVWVAFREGDQDDELVTAHLSAHKKVRNVRRDGRVALTILAPNRDEMMTPYLSISGTARIVEGGAPDLLTELSAVMAGPDNGFPPADAPPGYVTRITIDKVGGIGPWSS